MATECATVEHQSRPISARCKQWLLATLCDSSDSRTVDSGNSGTLGNETMLRRSAATAVRRFLQRDAAAEGHQTRGMNWVPVVVESTARGERAYDIWSRLLKERIIFVNGPIDDQTSNTIIAQLTWLEAQHPDKKVGGDDGASRLRAARCSRGADPAADAGSPEPHGPSNQDPLGPSAPCWPAGPALHGILPAPPASAPC